MNAEFLDLLYQIFQVALIPLLGIFVGFGIKLMQEKFAELQAGTNNEIINTYIQIAQDIIISCVQATNQTLVDTLKSKGVFTKEEWGKAFAQTKDNILTILNDYQKEVLGQIFNDLDAWIDVQIEAAVKELKDK